MNWTVDRLPWDQFDRAKVDPKLLPVIKAAAVIEQNIDVYATYLWNVFRGEPAMQREVHNWADDEKRHGAALARYAKLADPNFDFEAASLRYAQGVVLPVDAQESVRGSRTGELIARCMIEAGTTSHYWSLCDAAREPVLREICRRIAQDEVRHYKWFKSRLAAAAKEEGVGFWRRLRAALSRLRESEEDELAYAFWVVSGADATYDRERDLAGYMRHAYPHYTKDHLARAMRMVFSALGLATDGILHHVASRGAWLLMQTRLRRFEMAVAR